MLRMHYVTLLLPYGWHLGGLRGTGDRGRHLLLWEGGCHITSYMTVLDLSCDTSLFVYDRSVMHSYVVLYHLASPISYLYSQHIVSKFSNLCVTYV